MKHKNNKKAAVKKVGSRSKIMLITGLVGVIFLIALLIMMCLPEENINFKFAENMGMWQVSEGTKFSQVGDSIQLTKGVGQLYVVIPQMKVDADYYDVCVIEGSWPIAYDQGHLLFISPFNRQFDMNFRYDFDTGKAGKSRKRYIGLRDHEAWQGVVPAIMLMPTENAQQVSLKSIRFIHANPWTKIKAIWSGFTRYYDPKLGTCLAMATPILMGKPFNPFIVPILWIFLAICGCIIGGVHFFHANPKITKITAAICFAVIITAWGLLDLRNNVYYLKAISRNISLYWGKSIQEKRGIVVGDPEFIDFMKFCDENIPLDVKIINQVPNELPGTPASYLSQVQYWANLRPRFYEGSPRSYYIFYKPHNKENYEVFLDRSHVSQYYDLLPGEILLQELRLLHPSKYLFQISLWVEGTDTDKPKIELSLLSEDRKTIAGKAEYLSRAGNEAIFRFLSRISFNKNDKMYLQIANIGAVPAAVGVNTDLNKEDMGIMILKGKRNDADLSLRIIYRPKDLVLFKRFNDDAYILTDEENR